MLLRARCLHWVAALAGPCVMAATLVPGVAAGRSADASVLGRSVVTWPVANGGIVPAGTSITTRVLARSGGSRVVLTLVRQDGRGILQRRVLREGLVTWPITRVIGKSYEIEARAGNLRRTRTFTIGCPGNGSGTVAATLTFPVTTARAGEQIPATLRNVGNGCLQTGLKLFWQKLGPDGVFVDEGERLPVTQELYQLTPQHERTFTGYVFPDLTPGPHRAVLEVADDAGTRRQVVTAPLQIVG